jgi:anti-anti-sigma regulatory factor
VGLLEPPDQFWCAKLVQVHGGAIKICDANATVKQVMEVSGMSSLLHLYGTERDALAAFV